ncbi:multicopper oxidase family protein [Shimia sp. R10_1]|uniref:multicopper oxidase family protein n=1 Tax=Shimia sp. R10_1 TaxID=2821095 RepID=UPI001FFE2324|nr:multicopper oxidase family protein [Shimia sp. R10_1]
MTFEKPKMNRRNFVMGASALGFGGLIGLPQLRANTAQPLAVQTRNTAFSIGGRPATKGLVSFTENGPPPVLRFKRNQTARIDVTNGLEEYTSIHWHGLRIANEMDGVPYLTQFPIAQGETFSYEFTPPDAGTFWYHPHCNTMEQMAHGLTGMLIVEEDTDPGFDAELPINLKDFRLQDDGTLLPYFTARGAARGGTEGNARTVNWETTPEYQIPTGGLVRLRIVNTDLTRVYKIFLPETEGKIIAWNGNPVRDAIDWPTQSAPLWIAPGERVDIAMHAPQSEDQSVVVQTLIAKRPQPLFYMRTAGTPIKRDLAELKPLPALEVDEPDLKTAEVKDILFGWSPEGTGSNNGLCGDFGYTFWSINRSPWPGDAIENTGPVVELSHGKSYILRLTNKSPNLHPIHLHGLIFRPLRSNQRSLPSNWTDTILLLKDETIEVALRADNPGNWAFHCHVIEHQKSGLSGYISVV